LFKLPETMSFEEGALVEPLAVAYRTLTQAQATFQDRVAVIGGGTIGLLCLAVAKAIGVKETLITTKYDQQTEVAKALGADHVVDIRQTTLEDYILDLTNGLGADVVIETVGGGQNFNSSLAAVRRRGRVVLVAGYHGPLEVNLEKLVWSEVSVIGANCYGYSGMITDFQAAIDLISSGQVEATRLVSHRLPFAEIDQAFKIAADKQSGSIKVHLFQ
jgi:threonine dehydrogenase-like Zn-dependent dehydrogenase